MEGGGAPPSPNLQFLSITSNPPTLLVPSFFVHHIFTYMQAAISICSYTVVRLPEDFAFYPLKSYSTHTHAHVLFSYRFTFVTNAAQNLASFKQTPSTIFCFTISQFYISIRLFNTFHVSRVCFVAVWSGWIYVVSVTQQYVFQCTAPHFLLQIKLHYQYFPYFAKLVIHFK